MTTEVLGSAASTAQPWVPDDGTFGARLALIRQRMGWGNVKEAATACGLPTESWRTWERDGVEPRGLTRIARKIADATGCSYAWLLDGPGLRNELAHRPTTTPYVVPAKRPATQRPADKRPKTRTPDGPPNIRRTARLTRAA